MKREDKLRRAGRIGVMIGLAGFAMFGLMHGALVGGTMGANTARLFFMDGGHFTEVASRVSLMAGMVMGAGVTCAMFVTCGLTVGRLVGYVWTEDGRRAEDDKTEALGLN